MKYKICVDVFYQSVIRIVVIVFDQQKVLDQLEVIINLDKKNIRMSKRQSRSSVSQKFSLNRQIPKLKSSKSNNIQKSGKSQSQSSSSSGSSSVKQQNVMGEAIQKASYLIQLLRRDNCEFKLLVDGLEGQLAQEKQARKELKEKYDQLVINISRIQSLESQNIQLREQNETLQIELQKNRINKDDYQSTRQALNESKQKNKQLHLKIASLTKTTSQQNTSLSALKKQFLSLQNQNQYLLNQLKKHNQKQNIYNNNINQRQTQFNYKLISLDKTKQAFARRTHQLQQQIMALLIEIQQLKKDKIDLQIITQQSMQTLDALTLKLQSYRMIDNKIHQIYQKIKLQQKPNNNTLNTTKQLYNQADQVTTNQKLYQIELILNYRLQHMHGLLQQIIVQVNKSQWKTNLNLGNLKQTQLVIQRLNDYLNQLSTCSLINDKNII